MRKVILGLVVAFIILWVGAGFYLDLLWFDNLGFSSVFWTFFTYRWLLRLLAGLVFFLFLFGNLLMTRSSLLQLHNL
ncbi:MAG: COG1615 family transporter, partial [Firmicutes bacterium]|nr:COG1615 family transporter [Bacillota bacterium]